MEKADEVKRGSHMHESKPNSEGYIRKYSQRTNHREHVVSLGVPPLMLAG